MSRARLMLKFLNVLQQFHFCPGDGKPEVLLIYITSGWVPASHRKHLTEGSDGRGSLPLKNIKIIKILTIKRNSFLFD